MHTTQRDLETASSAAPLQFGQSDFGDQRAQPIRLYVDGVLWVLEPFGFTSWQLTVGANPPIFGRSPLKALEAWIDVVSRHANQSAVTAP